MARAAFLAILILIGFLARLAWDSVADRFLRPVNWRKMLERIAAWLFCIGIAAAIAGVIVQLVRYGTITQFYWG
jgi:hypothetical protein